MSVATHPIVLKKRLRVIEALEAGDPQSVVAEREGLSCKAVRKWRDLWEAHGEQWLHDRMPRRRPVMPNQTPLEVELAIVDDALAHPEQGPKMIAAFLRPKYGVGVTAVYGTLKRRGLETRAKRLEELQRRMGPTEPDQVERDRRMSKHRHLKAPVPRHLVAADTAVVGWLKEVGVVHMALAIDVHSSYATVVLGDARNSWLAGAALLRLDEELKHHGVEGISRALTDNGTEFEGKPDHVFEETCRDLGAEHRYTKVRRAWTNGTAERFVQTVKEALEGLLRRKIYRSIEELQDDLDAWIEYYNWERPHQGRYNGGRPPGTLLVQPPRCSAA